MRQTAHAAQDQPTQRAEQDEEDDGQPDRDQRFSLTRPNPADQFTRGLAGRFCGFRDGFDRVGRFFRRDHRYGDIDRLENFRLWNGFRRVWSFALHSARFVRFSFSNIFESIGLA